MKNLLRSILIGIAAILSTAFVASAAPSILQTFQGGTGSSTPSGILYGDNNATTHLNTVTIGSGCTFSTGTLSCTGTGSGVFPFTPTTNYGVTANATNTPIWFKQGLQASSTATLKDITIPGSGDNLFINENSGGTGTAFNISVPNSGSLTIGSADYMEILSVNKDVVFNPNLIASGGTSGFIRIPASNGTPGVPLNDGSFASRSMAFDSTNNKLLIYNGGWINMGAFSFTPKSYGNATSTTLGFLNGFLSTASSTIVGNATTTGTFFAGIASSTSLFGAGLASCTGGSNALTWSGGTFGCNSISAGAGSFPFTPQADGNATSTELIFKAGFLSTASSTFNGNATTTGTFFAGIASSTSLFGANLNTCNAGNVLTWAAGKFGCVADAQGTGAYPFTPSTDNGINTSATSTPIQGTHPGLGLDISDTSWYGIGGHIFAYGSTTNQSTILGLDAGGNNATTSAVADNTTAVGFWALKSNVGSNNSAFGSNALLSNTTGSSNIAFGSSALFSNTTGNNDAAFGLSALQGNTSGVRNTAFGSNSLQGTTIGSNNVGIGQRTGISNTTGNGNTYIGAFADTGVVGLSTSTAIGAGASVNASNSLTLGGITNSAVLVGIGTTSPFARLSIHANTDDGVSDNTLFAIGSSTASVTSTLFSVSNTGLASTTNLIVSGAGGTPGCATFSAIGQISNTGTACGSGSGSTFPFTAQSYGNSTSTNIGFLAGLFSNGSTTISSLSSGLVGANNGLLYGFASTSLFGFTPASNATTLTIAGTANQLTSSAGAQDLTTNRTWTLSLPQALQFPLSFTSTYGTTTYASSTALTATNLWATNATTSGLYITGLASQQLYVDSTGLVKSGGTGTNGNCVKWGANNLLADQGAACGSGGGSDPFSHPFLGYSASTTAFSLGTSTPNYLSQLTVGSSTAPQLALVDNSQTSFGWTFRSMNGNLFIATSSAATFATSTNSIFSIIQSPTANATTTFLGTDITLKQTSQTALNIFDNFGSLALNVNTASSTGFLFQVVATTTSNANAFGLCTTGTTGCLFGIDQYGHMVASSTGATPTVSSCGTTPTLAANANDVTGTINAGSGGITACTLTFAHPYTLTPTVIVSDNSTTAVTDVSAVSTTAFTVSFASSLTSPVIYYIVVQP